MPDQKRTKFGPPTMALAQRTKHSSLIAENKEEIAAMLLGMTSVPITDVVQWTSDGRMLVKSSDDLQGFAAHAIKKIRQVTDKDGNLVIEVELVDKVQLMRILAKASGLLDPPKDDEDRPSILGINIKAPETMEYEER